MKTLEKGREITFLVALLDPSITLFIFWTKESSRDLWFIRIPNAVQTGGICWPFFFNFDGIAIVTRKSRISGALSFNSRKISIHLNDFKCFWHFLVTRSTDGVPLVLTHSSLHCLSTVFKTSVLMHFLTSGMLYMASAITKGHPSKIFRHNSSFSLLLKRTSFFVEACIIIRKTNNNIQKSVFCLIYNE